MDVNTLTDDEVIDLQDKLALRAEFIRVTPGVESEVRARLATLDEDRKDALPWRDALHQLAR